MMEEGLSPSLFVIHHIEIHRTCRWITGYLAVPISDLFARPSGPLNSQPRRLCRRAQLAAAFARQARSSSGGERYFHSRHECKVSRHPGDSGKDRPAWLGWTPGPIRKYLSAAPVDVSTANISFRVLAFRQSPGSAESASLF